MATAGGGALGVAGPIHKQEHGKSASSLPTGRSRKRKLSFSHVEEKNLSALRQQETEMVRLLIGMRKARAQYGSLISNPSADETLSPWEHVENTVRLIERMNALGEDYRRLRQSLNTERARTGTTSSGRSDKTALIAPYQRETTVERETTEYFLSYVWKKLREESRHLKKGSLETFKLTSVHKPSKKLKETQETCESNDEEADAIVKTRKLIIKIPPTKLTSVRQPSKKLKETLESRESNNEETDAKILKVMIESPHIKKGWMEREEYDYRASSALEKQKIGVQEGWSKEMKKIKKEYFNLVRRRCVKKNKDKIVSDVDKIYSEHARDDVSIEKKGNVEKLDDGKDILNPVPESSKAHQQESRGEIPDTVTTIPPNQMTETPQIYSEHVRDDGVSIEKKGNVEKLDDGKDILNPVPESSRAHQQESRGEIPDTVTTIPPNQMTETPQIYSEHVRDEGVSIEKKGNGGAHQQESRGEIPDTVITITPNQTTEALQMSNITTSWEIVRCIVAGGLFQSIASLVIVTSAATANIFDGNIITLALTYLVSGFFFMRHDPATALERRKLREHNRVIQRLSGMLRASLHYHFHYMVTILSLLFFGVVPPLVYAFTFRNFDDKNLKLAAAAGASLSCAALLAVLKAHLEKLEHQLVSYTKTAASFVVFGVVAFVLSYFAGALFGKLLEEVGWFE